MDFKLDKLKNYVDVYQITNIANKVKNAVYNYSEMEIKVRDATNNETWGASSTLMQEIAAGTHQYMHFNEIMETIFRRFSEKGDSQWRQIYKSLQLLEYLIKNGAERVIDSARSHVYEIKSLRNFHFIDDKGKDQGINVRNRAKEICDLLDDTERIKLERKKAKENRNKYTGVASSTGSSGQYGGFGSDGGFSGGRGMSGGYGDYDGQDNYGASSFKDDPSPSRGRDAAPSVPGRNAISIPPRTSSRSPVRQQPASPRFSLSEKTKGTTGSTANLLDMGENDDEWGDFASGPSANTQTFEQDMMSAKSNTTDTQKQNFGQTMAAPIPTANKNDLFGGFDKGSSAANTQQASFSNSAFGGSQRPTQQADVSAQWQSFSTPNAQTANFMTSATRSTQQQQIQQPQFQQQQYQQHQYQQQQKQQHSFGNPAQQNSQQSNDPFSRLVSLDADSLSGTTKRQNPMGPSLNAIQSATPINYAAFGHMQGQGGPSGSQSNGTSKNMPVMNGMAQIQPTSQHQQQNKPQAQQGNNNFTDLLF